jgi:hypothetical protein
MGHADIRLWWTRISVRRAARNRAALRGASPATGLRCAWPPVSPLTSNPVHLPHRARQLHQARDARKPHKWHRTYEAEPASLTLRAYSVPAPPPCNRARNALSSAVSESGAASVTAHHIMPASRQRATA